MASDKWQSLYYPGEAALGLLTLAEIDVEEREKSTQVSALGEDIEHDHWALLATARSLSMLDQYYMDTNVMEYWLVYNNGVRVAQSLASSATISEWAQHLGYVIERR